MNDREFNKHINSCRVTRKKMRVLSIAKVEALPTETKTAMTMHIIKRRGPVIVQLVTDAIDRSWLHSMGYLHRTTGAKSGFEFIHTAEHQIK